jgi:hypothetical protein
MNPASWVVFGYGNPAKLDFLAFLYQRRFKSEVQQRSIDGMAE